MRLSTEQFYQQSINSILDQQSRLSETNLQIASGKNNLRPSDDPVAATRVLSLSSGVAAIEQYTKNIDTAKTQLSQSEQLLGQAGNVLQRARELIVQANNDTLSASDRGAIATELETLKQEMLSLTNSRNESGNYIFAGSQSGTQPFQSSGPDISYQGDQSTRMLQIGVGVSIESQKNGLALFGSVDQGNGTFVLSATDTNTGSAIAQASSDGAFSPDNYEVNFDQLTATDPVTYEVLDGAGAIIASGNYVESESISFNGVSLVLTGVPDAGDQFLIDPAGKESVFDVLTVGIDALNNYSSNSLNSALFHNKMNATLSGLDQSLNHLLDERAGIGARLNALDSQQEVHEKNMVSFKTTLSEIQDLDYAEAVNELNLRLTSLQAAQQAYVQIQNLSLFRFLS